MASPTLTIAIPTYNRVRILEQTLGVLFPQLTDEVELVISDNCSTDGTPEYVSSLQRAGSAVRFNRQSENLGADLNMISCFEIATGKYLWLLCDDDLPCSNAVQSILSGIRAHGTLGMYYLRVIVSDKDISDYSAAPVDTGWAVHDRDAFARAVGAWVTFASSIIVRREAFGLDFVKRQIGTSLISAAITLSVTGRENSAAISEKPLLYMRGNNTGGYDAYTVFTRNLHLLLEQVRQFGYSDDALNHIFADSLANVFPFIITAFPATRKSIQNLVRYGFRYREFYANVLPALLREKTGIVLPRPRWTVGLPTRISGLASGFTRVKRE